MSNIDYSAYLHVAEDGHIWWLRQDALRLGAGFVPVCDDSRQMEPELQAPNQRVLVNEKNLMGALSDARMTIPKPMTLEREDFRYVDAAGFLEWLSQYICLTQAKIGFPDELARQVRRALAKATTDRPRQPFESLSLALEGCFTKPFDGLSEELQRKVEQAFHVHWDSLSKDQRRSLSLQHDYQYDPATQADREFWFDFIVRMDEVQEQIKEWESKTTPTATDKEIQERRLRELRQELNRMKVQQRQARGDYFPELIELTSSPTSSAADNFIAYPKAMKMLADRLSATPEELAAWIFLGPDVGGIAAYLNANELNPPPRFHFDVFMGEDYLSPMMACWFREDDIDKFDPADRYMTGSALIERWSQPGIRPDAFIHAKIAESRLIDIHPTFGGTHGRHADESGFPPLEACLFSRRDIDRIEKEDDLGFDSEPAIIDAETEQASENEQRSETGADKCAVFRKMVNLHPSEISITIVGNKTEGGLAGNNMLEIVARKTMRRVSLAALDLVNSITGAANTEGVVLVGLAKGEKSVPQQKGRSATMKRLRKVFHTHLGVIPDPFMPYNKACGWQPLFSIVDARGRADERAKQKAEYLTRSYEHAQERGEHFSDSSGYTSDEEDEEGNSGVGEQWLQKNDPDRVT